MSKRQAFDITSLLKQVKEIARSSPKSHLFFSMSTSIAFIMEQPIVDIFVLSFGQKVKLPVGVIHKHVNDLDPREFEARTPFVLDTLLMNVNDGTVIDKYRALDDISSRTIRTLSRPSRVIPKREHLIIRAAALMAETGFCVTPSLVEEAKSHGKSVANLDGKQLWREFKRLLKAKTPSIGIEFLRKCGALEAMLPELTDCYGVDQNYKYHKYTVYEHLLEACDACDRYNAIIRFAALIHDIGKPETKGENENGATFHKHEIASTRLTRNIVKRFRMHRSESSELLLLVSNHMYQYDRVWKDSTVKRFIRKVGLTKDYVGRMEEFPLFVLRHADRMGRALSPNTDKQKDFEDRLEEILEDL